MNRVITFSRQFPSYHPKAGQPTFFVEQILNSIYGVSDDRGVDPDTLDDQIRQYLNDFVLLDGSKKHHTIRAGHCWNVGDKFSPRVWSGKPYSSKQITIAPDIEVKQIWNFEIKDRKVLINGWDQSPTDVQGIAQNDGLSFVDLMEWFKYPKPFNGQIICWNSGIYY